MHRILLITHVYVKSCATFLIVCFVYLKQSTSETWKNVSYYSSKAPNQLLTFQIFKFHDVIKCLSMKHETFYWINWEVHSLVMKFYKFMSYHKTKFFIKKLYEKFGLKTNSRPFSIFKKSSVIRNLPRDIEILGWCPARRVLPHGEKVPL